MVALKHDEGTMEKVYKGLSRIGLTPDAARDAVNAMHKEGVLFRERAEEDSEVTDQDVVSTPTPEVVAEVEPEPILIPTVELTPPTVVEEPKEPIVEKPEERPTPKPGPSRDKR